MPREIQLARSLEFFKRIGQLSPLLKNWYRCGDSAEDGLRFNVMDNPEYLRKASSRADAATRTKYILWNGLEDPTQGGVAIIYDAHDRSFVSGIEFEDAGALVMAEANRASFS